MKIITRQSKIVRNGFKSLMKFKKLQNIGKGNNFEIVNKNSSFVIVKVR